MRKDMPGRLLRLLSLLQDRREWAGPELAERLGVTDRTVRRDIDRLRALDYPVDSTGGTGGGYRLVSGKNLPPLVLDDDEAVAVAVGLVTATTRSGVAGAEESAARALAKLERVLPVRLRPRVTALADTATAVPASHPVSQVDATALAVLASCCRDHEIVSFTYRDRAGSASPRRVEPNSLVTIHSLWYLLAYDSDRADWRTFRVDRIAEPARTYRQFTPRPLPATDPVDYLTRALAAAEYRHTAVVSVALPSQNVREALFATVPGDITPDGPSSCTVRVTAESVELVVQYVAAVAALGAELTLEASPGIRSQVASLGSRLTAAAG